MSWVFKREKIHTYIHTYVRTWVRLGVKVRVRGCMYVYMYVCMFQGGQDHRMKMKIELNFEGKKIGVFNE